MRNDGRKDRREFLIGASAAAVGALAACTPVVRERFFRKHFQELTPDEIAARMKRLQDENQARFGRETTVSGKGAQGISHFMPAGCTNVSVAGCPFGSACGRRTCRVRTVPCHVQGLPHARAAGRAEEGDCPGCCHSTERGSGLDPAR